MRLLPNMSLRLALLGLSLALLGLSLASCAVIPDWAGGGDGVERLDMDNQYSVEETLGVGEALVIDMRSPARSGYEMAGASFDPAVVRLDTVRTDPDDAERVHYVFMTLTPGHTLIEVNMIPSGGGDKVTYKMVDLTVEE